MYALKYNFPLPTHGKGSDILDFTAEDEENKDSTAGQFLKTLQQVIQERNSTAFAGLFLDSGRIYVSFE